jgi:hypothetical protein
MADAMTREEAEANVADAKDELDAAIRESQGCGCCAGDDNTDAATDALITAARAAGAAQERARIQSLGGGGDGR